MVWIRLSIPVNVNMTEFGLLKPYLDGAKMYFLSSDLSQN